MDKYLKTHTSIKQRFRSSIRRGTGEAYLLMQQYPNINFSKEIINASLSNYAYDGQCEGSRAPYLFRLAEFSKQRNIIRQVILESLAKEKEDIWSLLQLYDFALHYAKKGDKEAYHTIYDTFCYNINNYSCWTGGTEIIELDGLKGMLFIADKVGYYLMKHPDESEDDFLLSHCQELYPELDVYKELEIEAQKNPNICYYINNVKETRARWDEENKNRKTYTTIIEEIEEKPFVYLKNRSLNTQEILQIADRFLEEKDKLVKARFLSAFKYVKYPYDYKPLLMLAQQKNNKYRLQEYAIAALRNIRADEIREFALEKIVSSKDPAIYVNILQSNYREGDEVLLTSIVEKFKNEHIIESLVSSYINVYQMNKTKGCQKPLETLYYKSNCGICRHSMIDILIENNVLSDILNDEIQYDSYEDTRELYESERK
ncbi:hypothetical protein [Dysgonomonas sp. Marseille-P4361]|uniref:hypothetical protein n=1 Tax=Dysgonomonas sp. Marseille-P4361 TaxID=2161820 RepID=UPI000D555F11|nr:hypothetical protein [Dysgonomonas sp. Marseille-P4361]